MKKSCFFRHNFNVSKGFQIFHHSGKKLRLPKHAIIIEIFACKDCQKITGEFAYSVPYETRHEFIEKLNKEKGIDSKDVPLYFDRTPVDFI